MFWEIPSLWIGILNTVSWPIIQIAIAYTVTHLDWRSFDRKSWFFRPRSWETKRFYNNVLFVRRWKDRLPDGASWFDAGFPKARLRQSDTEYLHRFAVETCRGEFAHWLNFIFFPVFFLWNPLWAALVMIVAGLLLNAPCIVVQRYNRMRLKGMTSRTTL